jgi:hypothetical protein
VLYIKLTAVGETFSQQSTSIMLQCLVSRHDSHAMVVKKLLIFSIKFEITIESRGSPQME